MNKICLRFFLAMMSIALLTCVKDEKTVAITSVTIVEPATTQLTVDQTLTLEVVVKPDNVTNFVISWESSNEKVATIEENGKITAVGTGTSIITVSAYNNIRSAVRNLKTASITIMVQATNAPSLITNEATNITTTTVTLGGNITNAGTPTYFERGVVYATILYPTTANNKKEIEGTGAGNFTADVTGLTPNTTYYVRAYAINTAEPVYGEMVSFTTEIEVEQPIFNLSTGTWSKGTTASNKCTWNGTVLGVGDGANIIVTGSVSNGRRIDVAVDANVNITIRNVSITGVSSEHCPLAIYNNTTVNLTIEENNTLTAGNDWAGIRVSSGSTLTIDGTGSLTATGGSGCAGIGGNKGGNGSNGGAGRNGNPGSTGESGGIITINSGTIVAIGGTDAAGIGGGRGGNGGNGGIGNVFDCPGHGGNGGNGGTGGTITINGGTVSAEGSDAIGGGRGGSGGSKGEYVGFCLVDIFNGSVGSAGNEGNITIFGNKTVTNLGGGRNRIVISDQ